MRVILGIFILFLCWSCTNSNGHHSETSVAPPVIQTQPDKKRDNYDIPAVMAKIKTFTEKFGSQYDKVLFGTSVENKLYVYVLKGTWDDSYWGSEKAIIKKGGYKIGLVDETNKVVIPIQYDKISNLGGTAVNLIEVELNGKLGAYDLEGHELLKAEYDGIYPYKGAADVWVQLRKGSDFGWMSKNGNVNMKPNSHSDANLFKAPSSSTLISSWSFDSKSDLLHALFEYTEIEEGAPTEGTGFFYTPSYLFQLGIVPEYQKAWLVQGGDFGNEYTTATVQKSQEVSSGLSALWTAFQASFMDARGYQVDKNNVVVVDKNMKTLDNLELVAYDYNTIKACMSDIKFQFIGNNLLEICRSEPSNNARYDWAMTTYKYYNIGTDGKITPLSVPGDYAFTRAVKINENYFKGCYARNLTDAELDALKEDEYFNYMQYDHLSVEDLDIMRNEIYARYGYKFKNEKWKKHFSACSWYKAEFDNVDNKLTEVEKHNVQVILDMKKKLEGNESKFIKKEMGAYVAAG